MNGLETLGWRVMCKHKFCHRFLRYGPLLHEQGALQIIQKKRNELPGLQWRLVRVFGKRRWTPAELGKDLLAWWEMDMDGNVINRMDGTR